MRVLVCGGRDYTDDARVDAEMESLRPSCIIHGAARGADHLAYLWAIGNGTATAAFPADWKAHGKAAGPLRNARMLTEGKPDLVVAFPGGRGTADMVRQAKAAGVVVREVRP